MFFEPGDPKHGLQHNPLLAIVGPRPIGWISTLDGEGRTNLAPYSFFNMVSDRPAIVAFSSKGRKDSLAAIEETGEFVCNFVSYDLRRQLNATSAALLRGVSEFDAAGLETVASRLVKPLRVAAAPAALECRRLAIIPLGIVTGLTTPYTLVLGEVVAAHVDDRFVRDGRIDTGAMRPILRGGYHDYFVLAADAFAMPRPG